MSEISILDLQNLRHLIGGYNTTHCKMTEHSIRDVVKLKLTMSLIEVCPVPF